MEKAARAKTDFQHSDETLSASGKRIATSLLFHFTKHLLSWHSTRSSSVLFTKMGGGEKSKDPLATKTSLEGKKLTGQSKEQELELFLSEYVILVLTSAFVTCFTGESDDPIFCGIW
jgi:hypothetical protein